jgi:cyclic pyranopterin phosphate synthase
MADQFSHLDQQGQPGMVDVDHKQITQRLARAQAIIDVGPEVMKHLVDGDIKTAKGSVFQTAIIAGTMGAKKTHDLIPLCHPLPVEGIKIQIEVINDREVQVICRVKVTGKTGVEMEALTGASVAALTIYDMCKAFTHDMVIKEVSLLEKKGGKRNIG